MSRAALLVTLGRRQLPFTCHVCRGALFFDREVKLNTSGMEFLGIEWANESATGLVCADCGYLHTFVSGSVDLWEADAGYPGR